MPEPITDRNLLFGLLAFQVGFVTRAALVAALKTWVLDKRRPLAEILREQNAIAPETLALLEAIVQKQLDLHGGDAGRSLASVSALAASVIDELERLGDPEVRDSLARAGSAPTVDEVAETAVHVAAGASSSRGLRFRILRPHARGGLGLVYLARDEELNRDVALKEIQERHADRPESRSRFMLEAEVTGGLEHPGIVPVYGLGQYADGRPFYAMRFIRGDSLKEAIERFHAEPRSWREKSLELRELLGRLIDVCNAMQYAHDRGVLHRDLKPGNIMLGQYGETLVVDWGLAKPLGTGSENAGPTGEPALRPSAAAGGSATVQGTAVGTPQYMSPEQAAGQFDRLGPASDVYSLGATLYSLLTGHSAFAPPPGAAGRQGLEDVLRRVREGDFPAPRQINPQISPPLEAICLKAMARAPEDRYARPRALLDDLRHWLADEPVSAWPEPWTVRARRWAARHRTFVTSLAVALSVGVVSLLAATALLLDRNAVIERKNQALFEANVRVNAESVERERQRQLAVAAQRTAEERLYQSVETLKLFALDARDYCEDAIVPGPSKRQLFNVLATQLDALAAGPEEKVFNEDKWRARIFLRETVALTQLELGRANDARKQLDMALKLADRWLDERPGDPAAQARRAAVLHLLGETNRRLLNPPVAVKYFQEAYEIRKTLLGNAAVERFTPGKTRSDLADSLDALQRWDEAIALRLQARDLVQQHTKKSDRPPSDASFVLDNLNWTYQKAATQTADEKKKRVYLDRADATSAELARLRPTGRRALDRWAKSAHSYARFEQRQSELATRAGDGVRAKFHLEAAEGQLKKHVQLARKLATSDDLLTHRRGLANALTELARLEKRLGRDRVARTHLEESLHLCDEILRDYSRHPDRVMLSLDRYFVLALLGRHAEVAEGADMLHIKYVGKLVSYRLAQLYALCSVAVGEARAPAALTPDDVKLQVSLRRRALECLEMAVRAGFDDWEGMRADADLDPLRSDPRFRKILSMRK